MMHPNKLINAQLLNNDGLLCGECRVEGEKYLVQITTHPNSIIHQQSVALCLECATRHVLQVLTIAQEVVILLQKRIEGIRNADRVQEHNVSGT